MLADITTERKGGEKNMKDTNQKREKPIPRASQANKGIPSQKSF